MSAPDPADLLDQPTQAYLRQLVQVVELPAAPELTARRRRALHELVEVMLPEPGAPLWTRMGVERPGSEAAFMAFARTLAARSGLSYGAIAKATEVAAGVEVVPKSTVHDVLSRDRFPRREGQLRALLAVLIKANNGSGADLQTLLDLRAHLLSARTEQVTADITARPALALCPGCVHEPERDPLGRLHVVRELLWTLLPVVMAIVSLVTTARLF